MSNSVPPTQPTSTDSFSRDHGHWVAGIFYVNHENPRYGMPMTLQRV